MKLEKNYPIQLFQAKYIAGLKMKADKMRPNEMESQKIEIPLTPSNENVPACKTSYSS